MAEPLLGVVKPAPGSVEPRPVLRCTSCGRFANYKTAITWGGYMHYSSNGDDWVDFECQCIHCQTK